jgi:uracil phosphoribosyltransferase
MGKITIFSETDSIISQFMSELRDVHIQKDRLRFRENIFRIGQVVAYEISKTLSYKTAESVTQFGTAKSKTLADQPVIATVLRAGIPLQSGLADFFNAADLAYISAYRHYINETEFEIITNYIACPSLENSVLILADTMLATGQSMVLSYEQLIKNGKPKSVEIVSVIGSKKAIEYVKEKIPDANIWIAAVDEKLNNKGFIVPGLGDAGDLSFGEKLQH